MMYDPVVVHINIFKTLYIALSTIVHAVYVYYSVCMKSFMVYDGSCDLHISTSFSNFSPTEPGAEIIFAATTDPLHTALYTVPKLPRPIISRGSSPVIVRERALGL